MEPTKLLDFDPNKKYNMKQQLESFTYTKPFSRREFMEKYTDEIGGPLMLEDGNYNWWDCFCGCCCCLCD